MATFNLGTASGRIAINTNDLKNADIALRSAGRGMLGFGVVAVAAFGYVVREAARFEKEMDFVQAVTNASTQQMDRLKESAISLAKDSVYGPIELSKAFVELAKAGASVEDIVNGVGRASVSLATAADVAIPFAGENLINILNTFKLGASDAVHVADLLAGAANASSVELGDLIISLKYAGPVAQGLGISIEEVNTALTVLGKVGIKGSTAGTSLRQIMLNLSPATKAAKDQLKELGIITEDGSNLFFDSAGNAKSLAEVFEILRQKTQNLNAQQKTDVLRDLFGVRAIPAALELLSQGQAGFDKLNEEINRTTAADVAAKRMDNLDGSIKRLKATLSAVFVEAGGPFQQMLKGWVDGLRNVILWLDGLPKPLKTFIVGAVGVIGVLSILSGVFLLTVGNIIRTVRVIGELSAHLPLVINLIKALVGGLGRLALALLTNPIFLVVAAVAALAYGLYQLYQKNEAFRKFIDNLWQNIQKAWDGITKGFYDLYKSITGWLGDLVDWFSKLPRQASRVAKAVTDFITSIPGTVWNAIKSAASAVGGFFDDLLQSGINVGGSFLESVTGGIGDAVGAIGTFLGNIPGWIATAAKEVAKFIAALPVRIAKAIGYTLGLIVRVFLWEIPKAVAKGLIWIGKMFWKVLSALPGVAWRFFKMVLGFIVKFGVEAVKLIIKIGVEMVKGMITAITSLPGLVWNILKAIFNFLVWLFPLVWKAAWDVGKAIFSGIWDFVSQLPGLLWKAFTGMLSFLASMVEKFWTTSWDIGSGISEGIIGFLKDLPGNIVHWLWEAIKALGSFAKWFWDKAWELGSSLWEGFKSGLFGSPHTKIEYAMWDMEANMKDSIANLKRNMRTLGTMEKRIPQLNAGMLGIPSPAQAAFTASGGSTIWQQNGPLIENATIRREEDAITLARELDRLKKNQLAARGRRKVG